MRQELGALGQRRSAQPRTAQPRNRRRRVERKPRKLTDKETEAMTLVGDQGGNVTAAARVAGKSRQAMQKLLKKAMKKIGRKAVEHVTQRLPLDSRGNCTVASRAE
jgi:predicted DNA-binding protein (UPF0251 family)